MCAHHDAASRAPDNFCDIVMFAIVITALGAPAADLITSLPGWTGPLPSKHWSGFVDSTKDPKYGQLHSHYWFAASENDPATDPVLVVV